jgi:hypothetical protein
MVSGAWHTENIWPSPLMGKEGNCCKVGKVDGQKYDHFLCVFPDSLIVRYFH